MKMWKNITLDFPGTDLRYISDLFSTLNVASIMIKDKLKEATEKHIKKDKKKKEKNYGGR